MRKIGLFILMVTMLGIFTACKKKTTNENPLLTEWDTPYGVPPFDRIKVAHFAPAIEEGIRIQEAEIDSIVRSNDIPTFQNTVEALEFSGDLLNKSFTVLSLLNSADSNDEMREVHMKLSPKVSAHNDNIYMNEALFRKVKAVYDQRRQAGLDEQQIRLTEKIYRRFVRAGALLDSDEKDKLKEINDQLSTLTIKFGNNLLAENKNFILIIDTISDLDGLPNSIRNAAQNTAREMKKDGKWVFTLDKPSMIPFLTYSERSDLREQLYKGYLERGNHDDEYDNKSIIDELVNLRLEKARLLDYNSFAEFVLDDVMAKTPENAYELLDKIWDPALDLAKSELEEMKAIKRSETGSSQFHSWDWWFYAEKLRKQKYDLDEEMIRPYLSLNNAISGIFQLANRLWGTTFRPVAVPLYNSECFAYEVIDKDESHLGILYMDFYPRPGKRGGAWCGSYRRPSYKDGQRVAPVSTIVCNFTRPIGNAPALLTLDETNTLFHEFGHAMHTLFSQVHYPTLAGVERDFVELPSQIMENWAFEPQMLRLYAKHYQTSADMPDDLVRKLQRSRYFNQGFITTELAAAAYSDMDIHNLKQPQEIRVNEFEKQVLNQKRGLIPEIEPRYRYPYFSHIFSGGYSAGYYSYLWSEVLDKDAYEAFVETGDIFNRKVAESFRQNILEKGGLEDGMDLFLKFRGAEPNIKPLLIDRGLIEPDPILASDSISRVVWDDIASLVDHESTPTDVEDDTEIEE